MMSLFLWSQLVVSLALLLDLLSFQLRTRRAILACLALSCALNGAHFALLGQALPPCCSGWRACASWSACWLRAAS